MKKRILPFFMITVLLFAVILLTACNNTEDTEEGFSFEIGVFDEVFYLGGEPVTVHTVGERPGEYAGAELSYVIESCDEGIECTVLADGGVTLSGIGKAVIRGKLGDLYSKNSVAVYALNSDTDVGENISAAFAEPIYLGKRVNVGIHPSCAHLYAVEDGDGFITFNANGELEFCGLRAVQSHARIRCRDTVLYEGMYSMPGDVSEAVISSLLADGIIEDAFTDIPYSTLHGLTRLSLKGVYPDSIDKYHFLTYPKALAELDLSGSALFDLSFLSGKTSLEKLYLDNCRAIAVTDNGLTLHNTLSSLKSLELFSISGAFSCFDRTTYDILASMVKRGSFKLRVLDDVTLDSASIYHFSETVFFSAAEYLAHIEKNGAITPHEGYSHAILCLASDKTSDATDNFIELCATPVSILELYGDERSFGTYVTSKSDLTLNLYDFRINVNAWESRGRSAVRITSGSLTINAKRGTSYLTAGNSTGHDYGLHNIIFPARGATCVSVLEGDVNLYAAEGAHLYLAAGNGAVGVDGLSDGSNPSDWQSKKHASSGGEGGYGIHAQSVHFFDGNIYVYGGNGGKGGNGGAGTSVNVFNGGYNGGNGGEGGNGGAAICCTNYTIENRVTTKLMGGMGGDAGSGGDAYLAGINGDDGNKGSDGPAYEEWDSSL